MNDVARSQKVAIVTVARSDYGILREVIRGVDAEPGLDLVLIAAGMHLASGFGDTIGDIEADGAPVRHRVDMLLSSDTPVGTAKSMGLGMIGFADIYAAERPDVVVVTGDRFEMFAATAAALPFSIPVLHIHGGELSEGAIDDAMRHAMTKMAARHCVALPEYRDRVVQLGETPATVVVTGAPGLDQFRLSEPMAAAELESRFGIELDPPPLLVTFHPATRDLAGVDAEIEALLGALEDLGAPTIFTAPNADPAGRRVRQAIGAYVEQNESSRLIENFGPDAYSGMLAAALVMIGNSSSGIIEAASFALPVVNIGNRQAGRFAGRNVLHAPSERTAIADMVRHATDPAFRESLRAMQNPYGDGTASDRIVALLRTTDWSPALCRKKFGDLNWVDRETTVTRQ